MKNKTTAFYRGKTGVQVDFSAGEISSDGAVVLLEQHGETTQTACFHPNAGL